MVGIAGFVFHVFSVTFVVSGSIVVATVVAFASVVHSCYNC